MSVTKKYIEMFDYLRTPEMPNDAHGNFVFGRFDPLVAKKMGELYVSGLTKYFLVSGGIGKDSGVLTEYGIPEADFLTDVATHEYSVPRTSIHTETQATNGGENVRKGMAMIVERQLPHDKLTVISHATSLRRLAAMLDHEGRQITPIETIYRVPTDYQFDPSNLNDRQEARAELLRLADWPEKGWLGTQADLDANLVDFARDQLKTQ